MYNAQISPLHESWNVLTRYIALHQNNNFKEKLFFYYPLNIIDALLRKSAIPAVKCKPYISLLPIFILLIRVLASLETFVWSSTMCMLCTIMFILISILHHLKRFLYSKVICILTIALRVLVSPWTYQWPKWHSKFSKVEEWRLRSTRSS